MEQAENFDAFHRALERLYKNKEWGSTIKYHNGGVHVPTVPASAGCWQRLDTQPFELGNKEQKHNALFHTNRKDMDRQVIARSLEQMAVQHHRWTSRPEELLETLAEKKALEREEGKPLGFKDASGFNFPIHELFEREL